MKKFILPLILLFSGNLVFGQIRNPILWTVSSKKINDKTYEIRLVANINQGWHLYSQNTPEGGPIPTSISFTKNPLVIVDGKTKEIGKLEQKHEDLFGVDVKQYSDKIDFVQVVKLKAPVKTSVDVAVEYMVCNDKECLPPTTKTFTVALK